jgi:hypothetical protein
MTKRLGAVLVLVALSGCGDAVKELLTTASCNVATASLCLDYSGLTGPSLTWFETHCATALGNNSSAACASTNRIGSCTLSPITGITEVIRYYSVGPTPWTVPTATTACTAAGTSASVSATFTPG